jgi:hypothetical protein
MTYGPRKLTYDQTMALSPEQRRDYITRLPQEEFSCWVRENAAFQAAKDTDRNQEGRS